MSAEIMLFLANKLISKEVMAGAVSLVEFLRKNPEWLNDTCIIEARIPLESKEQSVVLLDFIRQKMLAQEYAKSDVEKLGIIFHELTTNAFEHGCTSSADIVTINIQIAASLSILIVINPKGRIWDYEASMANASLRVRSGGLHGRGLLLVKHLASDVSSAQSSQGIKAVLAKSGNFLSHQIRENVLEIEIYARDNLTHRSFELSGIIEKTSCPAVIISIHGYANSSVLGILMATFHRSFAGKDRRVALCVNNDVLEFFQICGITQTLSAFTNMSDAREFISSTKKD